MVDAQTTRAGRVPHFNERGNQMAEAATKQQHPLVAFNSYLQDRVDSLRTALPPHMKPERFISSVMTAVQLNPDLLACERRSLWLACMRAAQDGLLPDGKDAAIVAYKQKAQYLPMYQGLLRKFRNSGQFKWITAGVVYEGEVFEHWIDENGEHFKHVPSNDNPDRKVRRVYSLATTKDGGVFIADLSLADINKRRAMSRASRDDAPWKQWPDEMMKKTALRVLSKLLPQSSDIDIFLQRDEQESLGVETVHAIDDQRGAAFGDVLDHFAASGEATPGTSGEAQGSTSGEAAKAPAAGDPAPGGGDDAIVAAHKRGVEWRAQNGAKKAMPGEFRDPARMKEQIAWTAGFDGNPLPTFPTTEQPK
jgi:recombination protein RecT